MPSLNAGFPRSSIAVGCTPAILPRTTSVDTKTLGAQSRTGSVMTGLRPGRCTIAGLVSRLLGEKVHAVVVAAREPLAFICRNKNFAVGRTRVARVVGHRR